MALLPKGISIRTDPDTLEVFYDVIVGHKGIILASATDFEELKDAEAFYYKHIDRQNIKRDTTSTGLIRYRAEFYAGPNEKPKKKTFTLYKDAVNWRKALRKIKNRPHQPDETININVSVDEDSSFFDFCCYWLNTEVTTTRSMNTVKTYKRNLIRHVYPVLGPVQLCQIDKKLTKEFQAWLIKRDLSPSTIHLIIAMTSRCLEYACEIDVLKNNVLRRFKKIKKTPKTASYWQESDVKRFINYVSLDHYFDLFYSTLRTGMRKGEVLGLKWDCVDFGTKQITVRRIRTQDELKDTTKSGKSRQIPMTIDLMKILMKTKIIRNPNDNDYVFLNKESKEVGYQSLNQIFTQLQRESGVSKVIRFHDLRHTFASQAAMKGLDGKRLQLILGHADAKMTEHYTHLNDKHLMESVSFIEKLDMGDDLV